MNPLLHATHSQPVLYTGLGCFFFKQRRILAVFFFRNSSYLSLSFGGKSAKKREDMHYFSQSEQYFSQLN